jgi:CubicO group peptidase (beta-lactamase class C family)
MKKMTLSLLNLLRMPFCSEGSWTRWTAFFLLVLLTRTISLRAQLISTNAPSPHVLAGVSTNTPQIFEEILNKHKLPGLAVVVTKNGEICDRVAIGVRKSGDVPLLTTNDQFHIGSCAKSMTATLAAVLIEEGKLRWDTTIASVFPELKGQMDKEYENVTIEQLLTHRGGVPADPPEAAWAEALKQKDTPTEQRFRFIQAVLRQPPQAVPGSKMIYSNQGYAIAGAMIEKLSGVSWETLMSNRVFNPLRMASAGFGTPGAIGQVYQPWGHTRVLDSNKPDQTDNPPAIAPAGTVHCSLDDLARYAIFHLQGAQGTPLLKSETLRKLHTPPQGQDYAYGWGCDQSQLAGLVLTHSGSNGSWYVVMWLSYDKKIAILVGINCGGENAEAAAIEAIRSMIRKWLPK